jgi:hypothetical protein
MFRKATTCGDDVAWCSKSVFVLAPIDIHTAVYIFLQQEPFFAIIFTATQQHKQ